jgi:hypothetical protein
MSRNLTRLIGIPWQVCGRNREGCDCLGLALMAQRELFARNIPDLWVYSLDSYQEVSLRVPMDLSALGAFEVGAPVDGDVAFLLIRGFGHLSTAVGGGLLTIYERSRSLWRKPVRRLPFRYFRFRDEVRTWALER